MADRHRDEHALQSPAHPGSGHETTDISLRPLALFLAGLVTLLAVVLGLLWGQFSIFSAVQSPGQVTPGPLPPLRDAPTSEPKLQEAPKTEMDDLRAEELAELTSAGWIDRPKGVAKIPIDDAMKILARKGLPAREAGGEKLDKPAGPSGAGGDPDSKTKGDR